VWLAWSQMPFSRHIEIGRVCLVNYGADYGKLVTIVDVLDQNRVRSPRACLKTLRRPAKIDL
jgi:ribosomal protein L14E/L6E/L27E